MALVPNNWNSRNTKTPWIRTRTREFFYCLGASSSLDTANPTTANSKLMSDHARVVQSLRMCLEVRLSLPSARKNHTAEFNDLAASATLAKLLTSSTFLQNTIERQVLVCRETDQCHCRDYMEVEELSFGNFRFAVNLKSLLHFAKYREMVKPRGEELNHWVSFDIVYQPDHNTVASGEASGGVLSLVRATENVTQLIVPSQCHARVPLSQACGFCYPTRQPGQKRDWGSYRLRRETVSTTQNTGVSQSDKPHEIMNLPSFYLIG